MPVTLQSFQEKDGLARSSPLTFLYHLLVKKSKIYRALLPFPPHILPSQASRGKPSGTPTGKASLFESHIGLTVHQAKIRLRYRLSKFSVHRSICPSSGATGEAHHAAIRRHFRARSCHRLLTETRRLHTPVPALYRAQKKGKRSWAPVLELLRGGGAGVVKLKSSCRVLRGVHTYQEIVQDFNHPPFLISMTDDILQDFYFLVF